MNQTTEERFEHKLAIERNEARKILIDSGLVSRASVIKRTAGADHQKFPGPSTTPAPQESLF